ncbi:MAG: MFS transporter [Thermoprotei archaeon]
MITLSDMLSLSETEGRRGFRFKVVLLGGAGVFLDGYDLFIMSIALILLQSYFGLSSIEYSMVGSAALIGATVGAVIFGNTADKLGRKTLFILDLVFFVVFAAASAFSQNFVELLVFRFLLGIGIGADYPVSSSYVAEFSDVRSRGRTISATFAFQGLGILAAIGVGLALLPLGPEAWRWMLLSGVVPAVIVLAFRTRLPETLRWYVSKGKVDEARRVFKEMTGRSLNSSGEVESYAERVSFSELFSSPYKTRLIFASVSWFLVDIAVYGMGIFIPTFVHQLFGANSPPASEEVVYAILYSFAGVGYWLAVLTIDILGRKLLQVAGFFIMAGTLFAAAAVGSNISLPLLTVLLAVFFVAENAGPNTTTWVYPVELFPTRIRGSGHGFAATMGKLGAICGVFALPLLAEYSHALMLGFVGFASVLGALITLTYGIETKKQSLEDVSEVFKSFYDYFARMSENIVRGARQLDEMLHNLEDASSKYVQIKQTEHVGDELVHEVFTKLNKSFVAPIEQNEISALTKSLDDVLDIIHAVAVRLKLYKVHTADRTMLEFSRIITNSVELIDKAIKQLPNLRWENNIMDICVNINELENQADAVLNEGVSKLFDGHDAVEIIKLKEVYEYLELVTDKCEDVADVLRDLVVKYS